MKYTLILLLFITNVSFGQDTVLKRHEPFRDTVIAGKGVIILDSFHNGRHIYIFQRDTSYHEPEQNFHEYELGDEGGHSKVVNNKLYMVPTPLRDTMYTRNVGNSTIYSHYDTLKYPVAFAGANKVIYSNQKSTTLEGAGFAPEGGRIVGYLWKQISGSCVVNIQNPTFKKTKISGLKAVGVYVFQLKVIDDKNNSGLDFVMVTVQQSYSSKQVKVVHNKFAHIKAGTKVADKAPIPWVLRDTIPKRPTAKLHIYSATTGVGLQKPLKFSSGTIPILIESGPLPDLHFSGQTKSTGVIHFRNTDIDTIPQPKTTFSKGDFIYGGSSLNVLIDTTTSMLFTRQKPKYDTIPCTFLISDKSEFDYSIISNVEAIKGFVVRDKLAEGWVIPIEYLDADKKPFDKNIIVWDVKEQK